MPHDLKPEDAAEGIEPAMTTDTPSKMVDGVIVHAATKDWAMGEEIGPCLIVIWRGIVSDSAVGRINHG